MQEAAVKQAKSETEKCKAEMARLGQLVNGEVPDQDFKDDAETAALRRGYAQFNDIAKTMETAIRQAAARHIEHVRVQQELYQAREMLMLGQDAPQLALEELREVTEERSVWNVNSRRGRQTNRGSRRSKPNAIT